MNLDVLDWTAGPFLLFYTIVAAVSFGAAAWITARLRGNEHQSVGARVLLPEEVALLNDGYVRAADTVAVEHLIDGRIVLTERGRLAATPGAALSPLAAPAFDLPEDRPIERSFFIERVRPGLAETRASLEAEGLACTPAQSERIGRVTTWLVAPVFCIGLAKIVVGASRHRPVGILVILLIITLIGGLWIGYARQNATGAGKKLLAAIKSGNARLARAPLSHEVAMAFALVGSSALAGTTASAYAGLIPGSGGGDGGTGCGGGGGGCGGCGGGGD